MIKNKEELEKIFGRTFIERNLTGCYRSNQEIIDLYKNFCCEEHIMLSMDKNIITQLFVLTTILLKII